MLALSGVEAAQLFVNAIFEPAEAGGYISIVEVPYIEGVNQDDRWRSMRQTYLAVRPGLVPDLADLEETSAWYFSPVIYSAQSRTKMHVIEGCTLWVDADSGRLDPFAVNPRPSIAIETSEGRHHMYWLLESPLSAANLEHYNKRLAYAIGADRSGWDANQLLRLPAGQNIKRLPPCPVRLVLFNPDLRYTIDMFASLPEPPPGRAIFQEEPLPTSPLTQDYLFEKWGDKMSARLVDLLRRRQADRSRALWWIYNECSRLGMSQEECYWLVRNCPNNKFAEFRYLAAETLWRDVQGGFSQAKQGLQDRGVIDTMMSIRTEKVQQQLKLDRLGKVLIADMSRTGMFHQTSGGTELYYLDLSQGTGSLMNVDLRSQNLRRFVLDRYAVNPGTQEWLQLFEHISARCLDNAPVRVHRFAHYDPATGVLYINRYDNQILRVTSKGYEIIPNGADGILFLNPQGAIPFTAVHAPHINGYTNSEESLWERLVLKNANLPEDPRLPHRAIRHILYSWVLSFFFKDLFPVKPIVLIHGETGSGKTALFKAVLQVLLGPGAKPDAPYGDEPSFDNAVTNKEFIFADNVDERIPWLPNRLALVATGYEIVKRKLYTNNDPFIVTASAYVGITARTPRFFEGRDDVIDRVIATAVVPYGKSMVNEATIEAAIVMNRPYLWAELLTDLSYIIGELEKTGGRLPQFRGEFRQADFGAFLSITAPMKGLAATDLYTHIKRMQGVEATDSDPLAYVLRHWLTHDRNKGRWVTAAGLHNELLGMPGGPEFQRALPSPRQLSVRINRNAKYLAAVGIIVSKQGQQAPLYSFNIEEV